MSSQNRKTPKITTETLPKFKTAYCAKPRVQISFDENSRWTKQSFRDECNVNTIMNRYLQNGEIPVINQQAPQYLDVTGLEFQEKMEFVAGAQTLFNELPSNLRNRFQNDPAQMLDFCSNPANRAEMASMGLLRVPPASPATLPSTNQNQPPVAPSDASAPTT